MKQEIKKYTVTIFNESYTLLGDESEHDIMLAASKVDSLMKEIAQKAPLMASYRIAALAALRLALQIVTLESTEKNSNQTLKKLIDSLETQLQG